MKGSGIKLGYEGLYGHGRSRNAPDSLGLANVRLGQNCPRQNPMPSGADETSVLGPLGPPLSIKEVAALIGVSAWTIRQRYLPAGLPHFRTPPKGKLIFYKHQIVNWLLDKQRKGGMTA